MGEKISTYIQVPNINGGWGFAPYNAQPQFKASAIMKDYGYFRLTTDSYSNNYIYSGSFTHSKSP